MNLNLRNMRKEHRLTQEKLASMIGATKRQIGAWERGENDLPMDYAVLIADVFGCSLDSLILRASTTFIKPFMLVIAAFSFSRE